jgi:hypothetical protein
MSRKHKRARLAVPVRISRRAPEGSPPWSQVACTLDVTAEGARLNGLHSIHAPGEVIAVERGKKKALFRVVWVGANGSSHAGQVGVQCIEPEKNIWDVNFAPDTDEPYTALRPEMLRAHGSSEKKSYKRFLCSGTAELSNGHHGAALLRGHVTDMSAAGCYVRTPTPLRTQSRVCMKLRLDYAEINLKGTVTGCDKGAGMWVEFHAIRDGDFESLQRAFNRLVLKN